MCSKRGRCARCCCAFVSCGRVQQGGAFVLGPGNTVLLCHRDASPQDHCALSHPFISHACHTTHAHHVALALASKSCHTPMQLDCVSSPISTIPSRAKSAVKQESLCGRWL